MTHRQFHMTVGCVSSYSETVHLSLQLQDFETVLLMTLKFHVLLILDHMCTFNQKRTFRQLG